MNVLCKLFGHKSLEGVYSGAEYGTIQPGAIDGIGRHHIALFCRCPRCDEEYRVGRFHLWDEQVRRIMQPGAYS